MENVFFAGFLLDRDGLDEEIARTVWKDRAKDFVGMMSSSMAGTLDASTTSAVVVTE